MSSVALEEIVHGNVKHGLGFPEWHQSPIPIVLMYRHRQSGGIQTVVSRAQLVISVLVTTSM